jgi:hypothetical protein
LRERAGLPLTLLLALLVRVPFWAEALRTPIDGDTAIVGLMARHLGQGTALWGQPYGSPLDAWLAAPFVVAMGGGAEPLRLLYFLLGLALVPAAWFLAGSVDPRAAVPAATLVACPPAYFLLLSAMPPPFYSVSLMLGAILLGLALRIGSRLAEPAPPQALLALWGALAGLALWTHLMSASVVVAGAVYFGWRLLRDGGRWRVLVPAVILAGATSAPAWTRLVGDRQAAEVVSVSSRRASMREHLAVVVPTLHRPLGGVLGTHAPLVADDSEHVAFAPRWASAALALVYGVSLIVAVRRREEGTGLLLSAVALALLAFPFPARSGPDAIRFLTPLYLPLACLVVTGAVSVGMRRAWILVLILASLHLIGATRLLGAWRSADRTRPPFLVPHLGPVRQVLEQHGLRHVFASYGPAYRLTYESGERVIASQPWNERFLHFPLPLLDEVRFAKDVAWVLTPSIPTDLPNPREFEQALTAAGGTWRRIEAGPAIIYHAFTPPFPSHVESLPSAGVAGDGNPTTVVSPATTGPTTFQLATPSALSAMTLVAGGEGPRLLRSMDVEVSSDGVRFETVARRRRREERRDLRWINGSPQYVTDHDLLSIPLGGRTVAAIRITPVASEDAWTLAEVLLHPSTAQDPGGWGEWLDPGLSWDERRAALAHDPRPDREDWYYRTLLADRHR